MPGKKDTPDARADARGEKKDAPMPRKKGRARCQCRCQGKKGRARFSGGKKRTRPMPGRKKGRARCRTYVGVRLWGNMLHIYIDKYMGKPSREVLTPLLRLGGPAQSGPIGPPLYNPLVGFLQFSWGYFGGAPVRGASPSFRPHTLCTLREPDFRPRIPPLWCCKSHRGYPLTPGPLAPMLGREWGAPYCPRYRGPAAEPG